MVTSGVDVAKKERWIPEVPEERLQELSRRIKPAIRFSRGLEGLFTSPEGHLWYIKTVDPFNIAYTWDPKPHKKAFNLRPICDVRTYHTYAYYGFFKPTIAEVLAQIPAEHLDRVVAFEIVESPQTASDLNREREALNAGYHVATTRLYTKE